SGGRLNASLFFENDEVLVNEVNVFIAPKIFGNNGTDIFSPVRGLGISEISECVKLSKPQVDFFDDDILLKYKVITEA
ncbi:MAG: riboflavin biosynthesis protein RibD, partial [Treponema sp.]|nr:riboflavin biosynthesis protein RibD [Treponema sp.]